MFGPTTTRQCLLVLLIQDGVCETTMTERFEVRLKNQDTVQDVASVVIYDASECSKWQNTCSAVLLLYLPSYTTTMLLHLSSSYTTTMLLYLSSSYTTTMLSFPLYLSSYTTTMLSYTITLLCSCSYCDCWV